MKARLVSLFSIFLVLLLGACNLPVAPSLTPTDPSSLITVAAATVGALQTLDAELTPQPEVTTAAPNPEATTAVSATATSGPSPTVTPQPCDQANFIQDVTIPDGAKIGPGQAFTKTWRLKNIGTCTWNNGYALAFTSGDSLGAPAIINLPGDVPPNGTVDVSVDMKAPTAPGKYTGFWKLRNAAGNIFGIGSSNGPFYVQIEVVALTLTPTATMTPTITTTTTVTQTVPASGVIYDFVTNACKAEWRSDAGVLPCPGSTDDNRGFVALPTNPTLETGATEDDPILYTHPEMKENGAITGVFPPIAIQSGYRFRATIACLDAAAACKVRYQLNYKEGSGSTLNLGQWDQAYDNSIQGVDVDLSPLAGKTVHLILVVLADGPSTQDQAVWVFPRVIK
jgi:hypothetical protein